MRRELPACGADCSATAWMTRQVTLSLSRCQGQVLEIAGGLLRVVDGAQDPGQIFVGDHAGQAVAGHQEPVAGPDVELPNVFGTAAGVLAAQVEIQHVLELVVGQLFGGDRAGIEQGVGQRVVFGELFELAVAQAVGARVADAGDIDPIVTETGRGPRSCPCWSIR